MPCLLPPCPTPAPSGLSWMVKSHSALHQAADSTQDGHCLGAESRAGCRGCLRGWWHIGDPSKQKVGLSAALHHKLPSVQHIQGLAEREQLQRALNATCNP